MAAAGERGEDDDAARGMPRWGMSNRLADALSPYLQQHRDNPVHWWEWSNDAFAEARRRDVPVLLSVGYAACHWCHVMAHESFEDAQVAAVINENFVAIKVDREERPDVDAAYLAATTAMTGRGGWPMTVFLTPDGKPIQAGTYYPRPAFLQLLGAVAQAWHERRDEVLAQGDSVATQLIEMVRRPDAVEVDEVAVDAAVTDLARQFDREWAGFGDAPKFPPSMVLEFLLRHHARTGDATALVMTERTLEAMARGGIYDQLAGGFARYSVDARWVVPHFEKMLYDNALLLRVYAHWYRATGNPLARRIARDTADFLITDLGLADGGFAAALDADTDGVEGLTYVWSPAELADVLGEDDGASAAALLRVGEPGTFEHGRSTLQLPTDPDDERWWGPVRAKLHAARAARPQPARDDKIVTSWNALTITALVEAWIALEDPALLARAMVCADYLLSRHIVDGRLRRVSRDGRIGPAAGVADDYGNLAEALLKLHQATSDPRWLTAAEALLEVALAQFAAPDGGFHDTGRDAESLYLRPDSATDNAEPSGQAALAGALLTFGALTGSPRHLDAARTAINAAGELARKAPRFAGWTLAVAEALLAGPIQVAVVGDGPRADALASVARWSTSPGLVLAVGAPDTPGLPLLAERPLIAEAPAAYVCRGFVCEAPVTEAGELRNILDHNRID